MINFLRNITFVVAAFLLFSCNNSSNKSTSQKNTLEINDESLQQIIKRGKLIGLTDNSSSSYFIYKGKPMGYEYELLKEYADYLHVDLEIKVVDNVDDIFRLLNKGEGDIVAANMTVTKERAKEVAFTEHHILTRQILIQRLPKNWRQMPAHIIERNLVRNPIDLIDKPIHVRENSSFYTRLKSLSDEIGGDIKIIKVPGDYETEQLIEMVAKGEIDYTVADENIAMINKTYYPNIDIKTQISFPQKIAWAVNKNAHELLSNTNSWIKKMRKKPKYFTIYNKYYRSSKAQRKRATSSFSSLTDGKISKFDELLRKQSKLLEWDWRLLASQIYQESNFDPNAISWAGAHGLMQILPETAKRYGVTNIDDPNSNIIAGTRYLAWINTFWSKRIEDPNERIKFVLASYNVGLGHVIDARKLAEKYGFDNTKWDDNVAEYLLLKSRAKYYNDTVVKYGYCRGQEPYKYVKEILVRYEHYKNIII